MQPSTNEHARTAGMHALAQNKSADMSGVRAQLPGATLKPRLCIASALGTTW